MVTHTTGVSFDILGIERGDQGHSCKQLGICSSVLSTDIVVHLQKVQWLIILFEGNCCLFGVVTAIDAQDMGKIMPCVSMASMQRK